MLAGLPLYSRTLVCMYCSGGVWVDACAVGLVCQGGIKKTQNISVETPRARVHAARVSHANTREGLSVPLEFFLHLNLPQKVSYGSYHMLILREWAPINMHVCTTPPTVHIHVCVRVWGNPDRPVELLKLGVLTLSRRPLLWRPRSGSPTRRPSYMCVFELGM